MKLLAVLILFGVSTAFANDYPIEDDTKRIAEILGNDWTVEGRDTEIIITSKFDVYHVGIVSRVTVLPEFSLTADPDAAASHAVRERYIIRLQYGPHLSKEELQKRLSERQHYADILGGAPDKRTWLEAAEAFRKIRIPRYHSGFNGIYRVLPDHPGKQIYPASAVSKIGGAKQLLDTILGHHHSVYE